METGEEWRCQLGIQQRQLTGEKAYSEATEYGDEEQDLEADGLSSNPISFTYLLCYHQASVFYL